jgi:hypothetical protein
MPIPPRVYTPKPSERAALLILAAAESLTLAAPLDSFSLRDLAAALRGKVTYSTLRNYVRALVSAGRLKHAGYGRYGLPNRARMATALRNFYATKASA